MEENIGKFRSRRCYFTALVTIRLFRSPI